MRVLHQADSVCEAHMLTGQGMLCRDSTLSRSVGTRSNSAMNACMLAWCSEDQPGVRAMPSTVAHEPVYGMYALAGASRALLNI